MIHIAENQSLYKSLHDTTTLIMVEFEDNVAKIEVNVAGVNWVRVRTFKEKEIGNSGLHKLVATGFTTISADDLSEQSYRYVDPRAYQSIQY